MFSTKKTCQAGAWTSDHGPRVLVECPEAWALVPELEAAGFAVAACRGPGPDERCPLLRSGECAAASAADVIVSDLPWVNHHAIEAALREHYPDTPLIAGAAVQSKALTAGIQQLAAAR